MAEKSTNNIIAHTDRRVSFQLGAGKPKDRLAGLFEMTTSTFLIGVITVSAFLFWPDSVSGQDLRWPSEHPEDWMLAFIDVETTGLIPGTHEMIDIGLILADPDGKEKARLFRRVMPTHPERISPEAAAVNGFSVQRWKESGAVSENDLLAEMDSFYAEHASGKHVLMVAFNSHFDAAFIQHLYRDYGRSWRERYHYFVLDIPSMAWIMGVRGLAGENITGALDIEDESHDPLKHTGITGAELNLRIYRTLLMRQDE